jgi:osmotically-inducible protein OsmY
MQKIWTVSALGLLLLTGCTVPGAVVGGAATAGVAASQERGFQQGVSDTWIETQVSQLLFEKQVDELFRAVNVTVHEGRVLLTGAVKSPDLMVEAVRLSWKVEGVREVINELRVEGATGLVQDSKDLWINTQLRTRLTFAKDIAAINYSIETVNGVVYLMGIAQSQDELARVEEHARNIAGVQKVVSYVRVKGAG